MYTCRGAAEGRQLEVLQWEHSNGCPWDTPLCNATIRGDEAVVRALIEAGADDNFARDVSATPLFVAAQNGHEAVMRVLIVAGADVNKASYAGSPPLHIAAQSGHEAVVRALIEAGANFNKANDDGATPLFIAALKGHEAVARAGLFYPSDAADDLTLRSRDRPSHS